MNDKLHGEAMEKDFDKHPFNPIVQTLNGLRSEERRELDLTKKLLESLLLDGEVFCHGFVYSKNNTFIMNPSDMAIAVNCLNRLNIKIGEYVCRAEHGLTLAVLQRGHWYENDLGKSL